jgi:hypothetical protein
MVTFEPMTVLPTCSFTLGPIQEYVPITKLLGFGMYAEAYTTDPFPILAPNILSKSIRQRLKIERPKGRKRNSEIHPQNARYILSFIVKVLTYLIIVLLSITSLITVFF